MAENKPENIIIEDDKKQSFLIEIIEDKPEIIEDKQKNEKIKSTI